MKRLIQLPTILIAILISFHNLSYGLTLDKKFSEKGDFFSTDYGYIVFQFQNQTLNILFVDHDKKVIQPVFDQGLARISYVTPRTKGQIPYVVELKLNNPLSLTSTRPLYPPFNYFIDITLSNSSNNQSYTLPRIRIQPD